MLSVILLPLTSTFAATVTPPALDSVTVNSNDSIDVICTDPTFDAGENIVGRQILLDNNGDFGTPEITVGGPTDTTSIACDGSTVNNIDFASAGYSDFDGINLELRIFNDSPAEDAVTTTFVVADNTKPVITPATIGDPHELELTDSYTESCSVSDNDPSYTGTCSVTSGFIDTSVLGMQSVTYDADPDSSGNVPDSVTVTTTVEDTTAPILTKDTADPITLVKNVDPVPTVTATVSDNDATVNGNTVICDTSSVDNTVLGTYFASCVFTDPSGNSATTVNYQFDVVAGNAPVITLLGANPQEIVKNASYTELGATASDTEDGDITGSLVIDSSAVNTGVVGSYTVNYDVTDSSGNTAHEERTVTVLPVGSDVQVLDSLTLVTDQGDITATINTSQPTLNQVAGYDFPYGLSDITINGITHGSSVTVTITYPSIPDGARYYKVSGGVFTDVTGTLATIAGNQVTLVLVDGGAGDDDGLANGIIVDPSGLGTPHISAIGSSCAGDCYSPHLGVDENNKVFYEDGLKVNGKVYKIDNVLWNHADKIIEMPVGLPVVVVQKWQDTWPEQIQHCELAVGIKRGNFDKQSATFIINGDRSFDGIVKTSYEGDITAFRNASVEMNVVGQNLICKFMFTPTKHLEHDMFAVSAWDQYRYTGTYFVNEGMNFKGVSEVGTPVFQVMDSRGRITTLTISDETLEDMTRAMDSQGNTWILQNGFWQKDFVSPDMSCQASSKGFDRNCVNEFKALIESQQVLAKQYFDSEKIQKNAQPAKSYEFKRTERGHDPVPNMMKAQAEHNLKNSINHSSYSLE